MMAMRLTSNLCGSHIAHAAIVLKRIIFPDGVLQLDLHGLISRLRPGVRRRGSSPWRVPPKSLSRESSPGDRRLDAWTIDSTSRSLMECELVFLSGC
jgi:hypothetical protein